MLLNKNNKDIASEKSNSNKTIDLSRYRWLLLILGGIILLAIVIILIAKLVGKNNYVYDDTLYYINLIGSREVILYQGDNYQELGYTASDENGKDLTKKVIVTDNINSDVIGNYKVIYALGNTTKERNIKVIEKPIGATYIHLYGNVNVFLYLGETYDEKGYAVIDSVDGTNLNDQVKVSSNVDTQKEGIYKIVYTVTNTSGVTTSKERTVIVMDRNLSLIPNSTDITNGNVMINIYAHDELFSHLVLPNNVKVTDSVSTYEVSNNGTYKFVMYNQNGQSKEKSITISNIDKESPTGSCSGTYGSGKSNIYVSAKDNVGISKYVLNGTNYTNSNITINQELSSVNITIYDKAGNTKTISCKLNGSGGTPQQPSSSQPSSSSSRASSSSSSAPSSNKVPINVKAGTYLKYDKGVKYYIIIPEGATKNMPLVTFLVGGNPSDAFGSPESKIMKANPTKNVLSGKAYSYQKFIYIYPEYRTDNTGSYSQIKSLIDFVADKYYCNKDKIILTGVSNGAVATFWIAYEYPNYFSAVLPISGPAWGYGPLKMDYKNKAKSFVGTSFFGITGVKSIDIMYGSTQKELIKKVHAIDSKSKAFYANSNASFSEIIKSELGKNPTNLPKINEYDHGTTMQFYQVPEFWEWMLKQ